ncbi:MAG: tetratricopeptide repeat protein, partial [Gammaproteobacteria bacterium]
MDAFFPLFGIIKALSGVHDITRLRLAKVQWAAGQIDQAIKTLEAKHSDVYD